MNGTERPLVRRSRDSSGARGPAGSSGRTVLFCSLPHRQVKPRPDAPAAVAGAVSSPVVRAGERFHHVQAVRTVIVPPASPGATEVFGFDPDVIRVQLGPDGEELT